MNMAKAVERPRWTAAPQEVVGQLEDDQVDAGQVDAGQPWDWGLFP